MTQCKRFISLLLSAVMLIGLAQNVYAGGATDFYPVPGLSVNYTKDVAFNVILTEAEAFQSILEEYNGTSETELFDTSNLIKDSTGAYVTDSDEPLDPDSTYTFEYYFYPNNQYEWPSSIYALTERTKVSEISDFYVKVNGVESEEAEILYYYGGVKLYVPLGKPSTASLDSIYLTELNFSFDKALSKFDTLSTGTECVDALESTLVLPDNTAFENDYTSLRLKDTVTGNSVWDETLKADRDYILYVDLIPQNGYRWNDDIKQGNISDATKTIVTMNGVRITEGYTNYSSYSNSLCIAINIGKPECPHNNTTEEVTKKATTSNKGVLTITCTDCGHTYTKSIAKISSVNLSYSKKNYTGSKISAPTLTIKDANGKKLVKDTDYTVTGLIKRTNVGRYKVTVTFKGKYSGTKTLYYTITPKAPTTVKVNLRTGSGGYDDVVCTWSKCTGATGYAVYYKKATASSYTLLGRTTGTSMTKKDLTDGVKYIFKVVPYYKTNGTRYISLTSKTASIYTLKKLAAPTLSTSSGKVKVKWVNINGESGYQISRSTSKTGTNIVSTYSTTSGTYRNISANKGVTYYYKVRAYKVVNGTKVFGPWSNVSYYKR